MYYFSNNMIALYVGQGVENGHSEQKCEGRLTLYIMMRRMSKRRCSRVQQFKLSIYVTLEVRCQSHVFQRDALRCISSKFCDVSCYISVPHC